MGGNKYISPNKVARTKINSIVDQIRENGNTLVVQIMDYRGDDLKGYLIQANPSRIQEINGMFENKEFVNSLETLKSIR